MPTYDFEAVDGPERLELYFTHNDRPAIGEAIEHQGRRWRRIPSLPEVHHEDISFFSRQMRKWDPDAPGHVQSGKWRGCPSFGTKRAVKEYVEKKRAKGQEISYGEMD